MGDTDLAKRLEALIENGTKVAMSPVTEWGFRDAGPFTAWRSRSQHFLHSILGPDHVYTKSFEDATDRGSQSHVRNGVGILQSVLADLSSGHLTTTLRELLHAEVFGDFLDMAEHLLAQRYKDPAAVLVGGLLEEHLRQLCRRYDIDTYVQTKDELRPKKAEAMNTDLAKAGVYSVLDQKNVSAWLDLRNKAAHGRYAEYDAPQVDLMLRGVRDFAARFPA